MYLSKMTVFAAIAWMQDEARLLYVHGRCKAKMLPKSNTGAMVVPHVTFDYLREYQLIFVAQAGVDVRCTPYNKVDIYELTEAGKKFREK